MNRWMENYVIRKMTPIDIDDVLYIDLQSFSHPWTREVFEQELIHNNYAHYYVLESEKDTIGYVGMWIVEDDAQITNIAILPSYRGKKLGEKLFGFAMQHAIHQGAKRLSLEVRVSNVAAQNLYKKFGLVPGGIRKNYYTDNDEDALVMWVNLC